jgi:two-component system response regulator GlrR
MTDSAQYRSQETLQQVFEGLGLVTRSPAMTPLLQQAYKAAYVSDVTLLIEGETGTGKQVLAQAIHRLDQKRCGCPFVTVHCSTVNETLAESELFGHHRGAFSGALMDRQGLFQTANHGTVFLDDVSDLPLGLQPKLLDVLQRGVLRAIGSDREVQIDVRIIAASNRPLLPLVRGNQFREDLYHRLNVIRLFLPPLKLRRDDLEELVLTFAKRHKELFEPVEAVDDDLVSYLQTLAFPGNIRELENAVQRMLFAKTEGRSFTLADWIAQAERGIEEDCRNLMTEVAGSLWNAMCHSDLPFTRAFRDLEREVLHMALRLSRGTRRDLARRLHTSERTLYYKMRMHHLGHDVRG